jgi:hypothetical protein
MIKFLADLLLSFSLNDGNSVFDSLNILRGMLDVFNSCLIDTVIAYTHSTLRDLSSGTEECNKDLIVAALLRLIHVIICV